MNKIALDVDVSRTPYDVTKRRAPALLFESDTNLS